METYQIITLLYYCYQIKNKSSNKYGVPDVVSYAINAYKSRTMQFYSLRTAQLHIYILKFKIEKCEREFEGVWSTTHCWENGLSLLFEVSALSKSWVLYSLNGFRNYKFSRDIFVCVYGGTLNIFF